MRKDFKGLEFSKGR
jgi:hypothetical protein